MPEFIYNPRRRKVDFSNAVEGAAESIAKKVRRAPVPKGFKSLVDGGVDSVDDIERMIRAGYDRFYAGVPGQPPNVVMQNVLDRYSAEDQAKILKKLVPKKEYIRAKSGVTIENLKHDLAHKMMAPGERMRAAAMAAEDTANAARAAGAVDGGAPAASVRDSVRVTPGWHKGRVTEEEFRLSRMAELQGKGRPLGYATPLTPSTPEVATVTDPRDIGKAQVGDQLRPHERRLAQLVEDRRLAGGKPFSVALTDEEAAARAEWKAWTRSAAAQPRKAAAAVDDVYSTVLPRNEVRGAVVEEVLDSLGGTTKATRSATFDYAKGGGFTPVKPSFLEGSKLGRFALRNKGLLKWGGRALGALAIADLAMRAVDATQGREDRLRSQRALGTEADLGESALSLALNQEKVTGRLLGDAETFGRAAGTASVVGAQDAAAHQVQLELVKERNDLLGIAMRSEPSSAEYILAMRQFMGGR